MPFRRSSSIAARGAAKGDYFGPFASAGAVSRTVNTLQRAFLLRSCSDPYFESARAPLPAVPDQALQRALHGEISEHDYGGLVDEALSFLTGESDEVKRSACTG